MSNKHAAERELREVNAILDPLESGWPSRAPLRSTPVLKVLPEMCVPNEYVDIIQREAERLVASLPAGHGWDVHIHVLVWQGQDVAAFIQVYFNGESPDEAGVRTFNSDIGEPGVAFVPALKDAVSKWPAEVDRLIAKFKTYPLEFFQSLHYSRLVQRRRVLRAQISSR